MKNFPTNRWQALRARPAKEHMPIQINNAICAEHSKRSIRIDLQLATRRISVTPPAPQGAWCHCSACLRESASNPAWGLGADNQLVISL